MTENLYGWLYVRPCKEEIGEHVKLYLNNGHV